MISFLKLRVNSLCGKTTEFSRTFSDATLTEDPEKQNINKCACKNLTPT